MIPTDDTTDDGGGEDSYFSQRTTNRLLYVAIFVVIFTVVGSFVPTYYYVYSDPSSFVDVDSATVAPQETNTTTVEITIDRTARDTYSGELILELSRYRDGYVERISAYTLPMVFEAGEQRTQITLSTPPLKAGTYKLAVSGEISLPHGVTRQVVFESNTFTVGNTSEDDSAPPAPPDNPVDEETPTATATPTPTPTPNATPTETAVENESSNTTRIAPPTRLRP